MADDRGSRAVQIDPAIEAYTFALLAECRIREALEYLIRSEYPTLLVIAACVTPAGQWFTPSDVLHELYAKLYERAKNGRPVDARSNLALYFAVLCKRTVIDFLRKEDRHGVDALPEDVDPVDDRSSVVSDVAAVEAMARIAVHLCKLSENQRYALELHYLSGASYDEIATALEVDKKTVSTLLQRAKRAMRRFFPSETEDYHDELKRRERRRSRAAMRRTRAPRAHSQS